MVTHVMESVPTARLPLTVSAARFFWVEKGPDTGDSDVCCQTEVCWG